MLRPSFAVAGAVLMGYGFLPGPTGTPGSVSPSCGVGLGCGEEGAGAGVGFGCDGGSRLGSRLSGSSLLILSIRVLACRIR